MFGIRYFQTIKKGGGLNYGTYLLFRRDSRFRHPGGGILHQDIQRHACQAVSLFVYSHREASSSCATTAHRGRVAPHRAEPYSGRVGIVCMEKIIMNICASSDSFGAYSENCEGIYAAGNTIEECKKDVETAISLIKKNLPEEQWPEQIRGEYRLVWNYLI